MCSGSARVRSRRCLTTVGSIRTSPPEPLPQDGTISHAIERIYPFVAQSAGYPPAVVMSKSYAVTHNDNDAGYASAVIRPLARVFDCDLLWGVQLGA